MVRPINVTNLTRLSCNIRRVESFQNSLRFDFTVAYIHSFYIPARSTDCINKQYGSSSSQEEIGQS
jgi:hypothetical protein